MFDFFGLAVSEELVFQLTIGLLGLIILLVIIIIILFIWNLRKTPEEKHAKEIAKRVLLLKENPQKAKAVEKKLEIKKGESTLKSLLIKKLKPKIESQLGSKIEVVDVNAKGDNFLVLADIAGAQLLLKLDSSGKILDYERAKHSGQRTQ